MCSNFAVIDSGETDSASTWGVRVPTQVKEGTPVPLNLTWKSIWGSLRGDNYGLAGATIYFRYQGFWRRATITSIDARSSDFTVQLVGDYRFNGLHWLAANYDGGRVPEIGFYGRPLYFGENCIIFELAETDLSGRKMIGEIHFNNS